MGDTDSLAEGDTLSVTVEKKNNDRVVQTETDYDIHFLDAPNVEDGTETKVDVTVSKTIYSTAGSLETVFVATGDVQSGEFTETSRQQPRKSENPSKSRSSRKSSSTSSGATSTNTTPSRTRSSSQRKTTNRSKKSLKEIADELIGDEEFEETEDAESVVGSAKRKARAQDRDPAIDPRLNDS